MPLSNPLPYDVCPLNLEYVLSKYNEISVTSNMMLITFLFIVYCMYTTYANRINRLIDLLTKYVELIENINDNHNMFDFANGTHNLYDPSGMLEFYTESQSDCESCEDSESDSDQESHEPVESNNRRVLRSETRKRETEYKFDRDYNVPLVRNRKSKSASTLGIRGKTWHLD